MGLNWEDREEIGLILYERFPDVKPLSVRFTDLLQWIGEIEDFEGDPRNSSEKKLEAIQMAWYEEWKADHEDEEDM